MTFDEINMKYIITLICTLCMGLVSLAQPIEPRTGASNAYEEELRRIALPQFNKFNGQPVDRYILFHWLEQEAQTHDPATEKVHFSILLPPESDSSSTIISTPAFLTASTNDGAILLPDVIKYYASLCGLIYEFKPNAVEIRMPPE
jgi:hypothetical protein